jgi:hypothetical protein
MCALLFITNRRQKDVEFISIPSDASRNIAAIVEAVDSLKHTVDVAAAATAVAATIAIATTVKKSNSSNSSIRGCRQETRPWSGSGSESGLGPESQPEPATMESIKESTTVIQRRAGWGWGVRAGARVGV